MLTKIALDSFSNNIGIKSAEFAMKHYKKLLAGLVGVYALSKIVPAIHNYRHDAKEEQNDAMQNYLLKNIAMNENRQTASINPLRPEKDTYNYVF